jgi:threonine/homoserine/homoserine lactone efflux protein
MIEDERYSFLLKGLKFGMILQFAIGPVCMYIFSLGSTEGFSSAENAVFAVTLVDFVYVMLAILGISSFIKNEKIQKSFKLIGALIVGCFGLNILIGAFVINLIPNIDFFGVTKFGSTFVDGLLLTATNPLTILFWTGVFSAEIAEGKMKSADVYFFGIGAVLATLLALSAVAIIGSIMKIIIPAFAIKALNILVGLILIYFSIDKIKEGSIPKAL